MAARPIDRVPLRAQTPVLFVISWAAMIVPMRFFYPDASVASTSLGALLLTSVLVIGAALKGRTSLAERRAIDEVVRTGVAHRSVRVNNEALRILRSSARDPVLDRRIAAGFGTVMSALTVVLAVLQGAGWLLALAFYIPITLALLLDRSDARPQLARLCAELDGWRGNSMSGAG